MLVNFTGKLGFKRTHPGAKEGSIPTIEQKKVIKRLEEEEDADFDDLGVPLSQSEKIIEQIPTEPLPDDAQIDLKAIRIMTANAQDSTPHLLGI